jgi:anti-sigma28 factor (negative regulator of flagellin synthesis)
MDKKYFNQVWEVEYTITRVKRISEAIENGNYENALDMLNMIKDKAKAAQRAIKQENY